MSASKIPPPPEVRWSLQVYTQKPTRLPLINSDLSLPHSIVFIGGLTDTLGTVSYLPRLAQAVAPYGFSITQLQLSSSLGGWGYCSLEGDAQEIALGVSWLRNKGVDKVILMGNSTGCQDIVQYLTYPDRGDQASIDAAILQAPVSDREHWEYGSSPEDRKEDIARLKLATKLVQEGKGFELMPRKVAPQLPSKTPSPPQEGNVHAVHDPPMTAYRFWSLYAKAADDDYFSVLDFEPEQMRKIWKAASDGLKKDSKGELLALIGGEDETIPRPHVTPEMIKQAWEDAVKDEAGIRTKFEILPGANHQVEDPDVQVVLAARVRGVIKSLGVPLRSAPPSGSAPAPKKVGPPPPVPTGIPAWQLDQGDAGAATTSTNVQKIQQAEDAAPTAPHPPSFDALVDLIASGRTDEIEGIRDIPLKINEAQPSESQLNAPKKPWE
ncbi:unnamed protein product [Sympodiomycopsis kandeliae]